MKTAYLQHGREGEPMRTESVELIERPLAWQIAGLQYTATGYGSRMPTRYMIRYRNKWRRVYCICYGNNGTLFIGSDIRKGIVVTII